MTTPRRFPILPLLIGALLGFIGGYFAAGGGRPGPAPAASATGAPGAEGAAGRVEEIQNAVARDPENPKLLTQLGNAWYDREDWDRAIAAYEKARRKAPDDASLLSDLGAAYRNRGEFKRAVALFERARQKDKEHWQSLLNLVLIHAYDLHDSAGAQRWFDELKRRYPEIPDLDRIQERISTLRAS
ncbi:MAG TPA: tetratricopeptide repeat protein [Thermoanaerobaculia bacterium]|nr:tetratricopeptide repeat protein [Thermoanaerobaculia bacterium]